MVLWPEIEARISDESGQDMKKWAVGITDGGASSIWRMELKHRTITDRDHDNQEY